MKLGIKQIGGILGVAALTATGLGIGCGSSNNPLGKIADQCGLDCNASFAKGDFAITGVSSVDGFFKASLDFVSTANAISTGIKTEIDGLKADLEITDADLSGKADLGAAIRAKLEAEFNAKLVVNAQPAKCEVDARAELQASVDCQAQAKCDAKVDPGKVDLACKGDCTVEASAMVDCGANVDASCTFKGPNVACTGQCTGTCTFDVGAKAQCDGTCNGECQGTCSVKNADGSCAGKCDGMCKGSCQVETTAAADCTGKCSGECVATGPKLNCMGAAEAHCKGNAMASVMCKGECKGDFDPPSAMVDCKAQASCDAQAKADASVKVECTPPSVDVKLVVNGAANADVQAQLDYKVAALRARLPKILASLEKGKLVVNAGLKLKDAAGTAVDGALNAFADAGVSEVAKYKLLTCAPDQFTEAGKELTTSANDLTAQVQAAGQISTGIVGG